MKSLKIDFKTRIKNPYFWLHLFICISLMCLSYFDLQPEDITTFPILWDLMLKIFSNPYMIMQILWTVWTVIYNPLTNGFGDNERKFSNDTNKRKIDKQKLLQESKSRN